MIADFSGDGCATKRAQVGHRGGLFSPGLCELCDRSATFGGMQERRIQRTDSPSAATQLLIEALATRSDARAVALVDDRGRVLAGAGTPADVACLSRVAGPTDKS